MNKNISVFLSARKLDPDVIRLVQGAAQWLAEQGYHVYYGGGYSGMMGIFAETFECYSDKITGVSTHYLKNKEALGFNPENTKFVQSMGARKEYQLINSSKVLVLPGGFGTMDELFEALTMTQLGLAKTKIYMYDPRLNLVIRQMTNIMLARESISIRDSNLIEYVYNLRELQEVLNDKA